MAKRNINQFLRDNPEEWYYPEALASGTLSLEEIKEQYKYFRRAAKYRLKKLGESEFADTQTYLKNVNAFKPLSKIESQRELEKRLYSVQKFLRSKASTIKGQEEMRQKAIESAQEKGLDWINESNIAAFGQYMDYLRTKYKGAQFDSERALRLFVASEKKEIDPLDVAKDFEYWKRNVSYIERVGKIESSKPHSAEDYKKEIEHRKDVRRKLNKAIGKK